MTPYSHSQLQLSVFRVNYGTSTHVQLISRCVSHPRPSWRKFYTINIKPFLSSVKVPFLLLLKPVWTVLLNLLCLALKAKGNRGSRRSQGDCSQLSTRKSKLSDRRKHQFCQMNLARIPVKGSINCVKTGPLMECN